MNRRDAALGILVAVLWGVNFVAVDAGLDELPPLLFVTLRYLVATAPLLAFVPRPDVGAGLVVAVGLFGSALQFGLLFLAMAAGLPAGLSSVVLQIQVPFTVALAALSLGERISRGQAAGIGIALAGITCIGAMHGPTVPLSAILLCIAAGASWSVSNVLTRAAHSRRPMSLLVYGYAASVPPLLAATLLLEGPPAIARAFREFSATSLLMLGYVVVASTWVGFGLWFRLMSRYDASVVAPLTLLVPPVGLTAGWFVRGDRPTPGEFAGCVLTLIGLAVAVRYGRRPVQGVPRTPLEHAGTAQQRR